MTQRHRLLEDHQHWLETPSLTPARRRRAGAREHRLGDLMRSRHRFMRHLGRRRTKRHGLMLAAGASLSALTIMLSPMPSALATTASYELYCPNTPVGTIVMNDTVTIGAFSTRNPAVGQSVRLVDYRTTFVLIAPFVVAAAALGNKAISGSLSPKIDAQGATPAALAAPTEYFSVVIPPTIPSSGLPIHARFVGEAGPFTVASLPVTVSEDQHTSLEIVVSGNALVLNCTSYPNNMLASGITSGQPTESPIDPVIAQRS